MGTRQGHDFPGHLRVVGGLDRSAENQGAGDSKSARAARELA